MRKVEKSKQGYLFIYTIGTIVLILSIFFILKQTVMGQEQKRVKELFVAVDQEEELHIEQIRKTLASQGYADCGITMTKTATIEGAYAYEIKIHHKNLVDKEAEAKEAIVTSLQSLPNGMEAIYLEEEHTSVVEFKYMII